MEKRLFISKLKRAVSGLEEAEIEMLLNQLLEKGNLNNIGVPKKTVSNFLKAISELLTPNLELSVFGKELLRGLGLKPLLRSFGDLVTVDGSIEQKIIEFRSKYKLGAKRELDQFFATAGTSVKKAKVLVDSGIISGKDVCLLGDDDFVSLALFLLKADFKSLTVFDIDKELLSFIEGETALMKTKNVHFAHHDCREELNHLYLGKFDVVMTDPPYTRFGMELFLNRALQLLGDASANSKYIYLFYGNSTKTPEKFLKIQEIINQHGLLIEDKVNRFAQYDGAESIGSVSSLYILKTTPFAHATGVLSGERKIYSNEVAKEERFPFVDHVVAKVFGISASRLKNKRLMESLLKKFALEHRLKIVDTKTTEFRGGGCTFVFVLASSNLVAHSWPELGALHIDLVTCAPIYNKQLLLETIQKIFSPTNVEINFVE